MKSKLLYGFGRAALLMTIPFAILYFTGKEITQETVLFGVAVYSLLAICLALMRDKFVEDKAK